MAVLRNLGSKSGTKAASGGYEEREVTTVTQNNKSVALMLVEAGYASWIQYRPDDKQI